MSADAASLPCPICSHTGVFNSVQSLRDRLICVSTNKILCPVCQEEVTGLDKLTIHLFSHVSVINTKGIVQNDKVLNEKCKSKPEKHQSVVIQEKKAKTLVSKNKTPSPTGSASVKFVKIYPKLPVISLNTMPVIDLSNGSIDESFKNTSVYTSVVKTETSSMQMSSTSCNICGIQFVDANILKMHKCLIHNIEENTQNITRYQCHLCTKSFKMRGSLMVHLRVAHFGFSSHTTNSVDEELKDSKNSNDLPDKTNMNLERSDNKQWQCDVCRKGFTTKYFLKKHKRLHTGETPYACSQCNKTFTFQQSYHKHLLYHNDEKPHICNYCGRAFKELSTLHNHQRIHTGEKPFSCETCGKCFRQRVSYLVHRRIHTGVMPYKCTACNKSFRYKVSQRTHKCQAQPPGTVIRQTGDLVEKLKKKHINNDNGVINSIHTPETNINNYHEISEANAELVRSGAKLSLEDTETEYFKLIEEAFTHQQSSNLNDSAVDNPQFKTYTQTLDNLIDSIPDVNKNMPSPSEILKNLCLSKEENFIGVQQQREDEVINYDIYKDLFL